jgi:hypothetical protein
MTGHSGEDGVALGQVNLAAVPRTISATGIVAHDAQEGAHAIKNASAALWSVWPRPARQAHSQPLFR